MALVTHEKRGYRELRYDASKFTVSEDGDVVTLTPKPGETGVVKIIWGPGDEQIHSIDQDPPGQRVKYNRSTGTATIVDEGTV